MYPGGGGDRSINYTTFYANAVKVVDGVLYSGVFIASGVTLAPTEKIDICKLVPLGAENTREYIYLIPAKLQSVLEGNVPVFWYVPPARPVL